MLFRVKFQSTYRLLRSITLFLFSQLYGSVSSFQVFGITIVHFLIHAIWTKFVESLKSQLGF